MLVSINKVAMPRPVIKVVMIFQYSVANMFNRYSSPSRQCHLRSTRVHGTLQAASHILAFSLPSRSRYSDTDPERMEG